MPSVSILIAAQRPAFFEIAMTSVMTQLFTDFELLVCDSSAGEEIQTVLAKWDDARIRSWRDTAVAGQPVAARQSLLAQASGRYVKFLGDQDMLFPEALVRQMEAATASDAKLLFTNHCFFDAAGQLAGLSEVVGKEKTEVVPSAVMFQQMAGRMNNFIGSPSNVLFDAAALRQLDEPFGLEGIRLRMHGAVAAYLQCADADFKIVGLGHIGTAIRSEPPPSGQVSRVVDPAAWFEWEWILRWVRQHQRLTQAQYEQSLQALFGEYQGPGAGFSELALFVPLRGAAGAQGFLGPEVREVMQLAYLSGDLRRLRDPVAAA